MGAQSEFISLFQDFQTDEFFSDAVYALSWTETLSTSIDRATGATTPVVNAYSAQVFLLAPGKSQQPTQKVFKNIQAGDKVVSALQVELVKAPNLESEVVFNGETYICKEIISDPVAVTWKLLLRN